MTSSIEVRETATQLAPVTTSERIAALDVVRGFALIGILLMNVEFFNRPSGELGGGMQAGLSGMDWVVSYFVSYFVTGKFWTIFSLLFGMGFAVMLTRAERAGRPFLKPYLRRIAALAIFGALHYILLWSGDILFSYAVAAAALLIVLFGRARYIIAAIVVLVGIGMIPKMDWSFGVAGGLAFFSVIALFLRGERQVRLFGKTLPLFGFVLQVLGVLAAIAGVVLWILPDTPLEPRFMLPALAVGFLTLGTLTVKYHANTAARPWYAGVGVYCFSFFMMTVGGIMQYSNPRPSIPAATVAAITNDTYQAPAKPAADDKASGATKASAKPDTKPEAKPSAEEKMAKRIENMHERQQGIRKEAALLSKGAYADLVRYRAGEFVEHAPGQVGFATVLVAMFLLGYWFVRSGVMDNTRANLPLFRKLALFALPFGVGLGLIGSAIAMAPVRGTDTGYQLAQGLLMFGNLPACLGMVGLVIVMMHSKTLFAKIALLAPFGRMALTNYLTQSLIAATFFFGYGLGNYGISRSMQMVYVMAVLLVQIPFSSWWLAHYRYGPMEWVWRALTYWHLPAMRIAPQVTAQTMPSSGV